MTAPMPTRCLTIRQRCPLSMLNIFAFKYHLGKNVVPPVPSELGTQVIDVGTGSGRWAVEVTAEFPKSPELILCIQFSMLINCRPIIPPFVIGDVNEGIDFSEGSVDLVHSRFSDFWVGELKVGCFRRELTKMNGRSISRRL